MNLYPLKFHPIYKYRIWGGNKLKTILNKGYDEENIGESWEISDVKGNETRIVNGVFSGELLRTLINKYKGDLVGKSVYQAFGDKFPLLIKFIDAKIPLSIQVHPNNEIAEQRHNSFGKNEMWYVMDADDDAEIIVGFSKPLTKDTYSEYLESGNVLEILNKANTKSGDAFNIPTGRVHAIGAGVLLAEIQQTSDITYRIFDYNRVDKSTGKKRELHNDLALDVLDFEVHESYTTVYNKDVNTSNKLIHTPYFKSNILLINEALIKDYTALDSFVIYICTKGNIEISVADENYSLVQGETILIPACINDVTLTPNENSELLEVYY